MPPFDYALDNARSLSFSCSAYLQQIAASDKRRGKKKVTNRRFIVTEGVFAKTGQLAPIPELVQLKEQYKYRLIVEDSLAVGVLGKTGRGSAEHFGVDVRAVVVVVVPH